MNRVTSIFINNRTMQLLYHGVNEPCSKWTM